MYRWGEKKSLLPCNLFEIGKTNMGDGADIEFLLFLLISTVEKALTATFLPLNYVY